jgi:hypothetical protein
VEAGVRSEASPRGVYGGQSSTGTGFSASTSVFLVGIILPVLHTIWFITDIVDLYPNNCKLH